MAETVTWLIVFEEGSHPLAPWIKDGFGHCWAAKPRGEGWLIFNPSHSHLQVDVVTIDCMADMLGDSRHIWVDAQPQRFRTPSLFTCVEAVKSLLGIGGLIFTPYQLWRYLDGKVSEEKFKPGRA